MTNTDKTTTKSNLSATVSDLIAQRQKWEAGTFAASNTELYALLGNTLDLYLKVKQTTGLSRTVTDLLNTLGIGHNSSTSLALKVVRLVFVDKGRESKIERRAFTYARVITIAAEEGIVGATLPAFIVDNHGIDEIRRQNTNRQTEAGKAKQARDYGERALLSLNAIAPIAMTDALEPADGNQYSLALVRKNADGTGSIVFGTNNGAALNAVLTIAGKALKDQAVQTVERNIAEQDAQHRAENAEQLMQHMTAVGQFQPQVQVNQPVTENTSI